jgi:hypothetical protein
MCECCGEPYYKAGTLSLKQWTAKRFCSDECRSRGLRGPTQDAKDGRWRVWQGDRRRWRSHVVMEEKLGRPLEPGEVVDHVNGDCTDDSPDNLRLFASHAEHMAAHWAEGTIVKLPGLQGARRNRVA